MALIDGRTFKKQEHPSEKNHKIHDYAAADYVVFSNQAESDPDKRIILQIDMRGLEARQCKGAVSQTIQIDKVVARKLMKIFIENDLF